MKKILTSLAVACSAIVLYSCSDQLDTEQHGGISVDQYYKTDAECLEGLAAVYSNFSGYRLGDFMPLASLSDDFYTGGGDRGNDTGLEELNEFNLSLDNARFSNMFTTWYNTIYRCNLLVSHLAEANTPTAQRVYAEALVLRAFNYLRLASYFGDVPLIVEEITDGNYAKEATPRAQIFAQVEADLEKAIASGKLLEKANKNDKVVNVTKQFAQALLGKAYVYESTFEGTDKWSQARAALDAVIKSDKYELYKGKYSDIFHYVGAFNCESMFEFNWVFDTQNTPGNMTQRLGWRTERFKQSQLIATQAAGLTECPNESYGFYNPSIELYKAFVEMEGESGYRLNECMVTYKELCTYPLNIENGKYVYANGGYFTKKFLPRASERIKSNTLTTSSVFFRYAEVLLLAAEAEMHGGSQKLADDYINEIKTRAGITNQPGNYTLDDLMKEKRLEMWGEGTRWPDVIRWGKAAQVFKDWGKRVPTLYGLADGSDNNNQQYENVDGYNILWKATGGTGWQDKYARLPFPQQEIDVNKNVSQPTGWN